MSSGRVRIDDELSLCCETSGRGATTVLLIPGWTMTTAVFERQLEYFAGSADYRFVTCDPRAHGESMCSTSCARRWVRELHAGPPGTPRTRGWRRSAGT